MAKKNVLLSQRELEIFDQICVDVVVSATKLDDVLEEVQKALRKFNTPWALVVSRCHRLRRRVYDSLKRGVDRGFLDVAPDKVDQRCVVWSPHLQGHGGIIIVDDPEAPVEMKGRDVLRWFEKDLE